MTRRRPSYAITVAICTLNRPTLWTTLESLVAQSLDRRCFEILIVDNSPDQGAIRIPLIPPGGGVLIEHVASPALSLSRARNLAIERCCTPLLAYIDDDAFADPDWLESLIDCFDHGPREVAAWGGPVRPVFGGERPPWLSDELARYLSIVDWGDGIQTIDGANFLAGTNIAFRTRLLRQVGGFRTELGRQRGLLLSNEDVEIRHRINALGYSFSYSPKPIVHHCIPAARLTPAWFLRRAFWQGISDGISAAPMRRLRRPDDMKLEACFEQEMSYMTGSFDEVESLTTAIVNFKKSGRACIESHFANYGPVS